MEPKPFRLKLHLHELSSFNCLSRDRSTVLAAPDTKLVRIQDEHVSLYKILYKNIEAEISEILGINKLC